MKKRNLILLIILLVIAGGGFYAWKEYTRKNKSMTEVKSDFSLNAAELIQAFEQQLEASNKKYLGKVITVTGLVKGIDKDPGGFYTVILGDNDQLSSVRCAMDSLSNKDAATVTAGQTITLKGACTGFNSSDIPELGSDVIINRSVFTKK